MTYISTETFPFTLKAFDAIVGEFLATNFMNINVTKDFIKSYKPLLRLQYLTLFNMYIKAVDRIFYSIDRAVGQ